MFTRADMLDRFKTQGMTPAYRTGGELAAAMDKESQRFATLVKASGYVPQES